MHAAEIGMTADPRSEEILEAGTIPEGRPISLGEIAEGRQKTKGREISE
jgi:hypothetical protein